MLRSGTYKRGRLIRLNFEEIDGITIVSVAHRGLWGEEAMPCTRTDGATSSTTSRRLAQRDSRSCDLQSRR
jgi:hypothetical protein